MGTVPPPDRTSTRRAVCGTSGNANPVLGATLSSTIRTPSPSLRNSGTFHSRVSRTNVSMPCQRVREKGMSRVTLPHAVHMHSSPCF